jgi:hypothetical protein
LPAHRERVRRHRLVPFDPLREQLVGELPVAHCSFRNVHELRERSGIAEKVDAELQGAGLRRPGGVARDPDVDVRAGVERAPLAGRDRDQPRQQLFARDLGADVDGDRARVGVVIRLRDQIGDQDRRGALIGDLVLDGDAPTLDQVLAINLSIDTNVVLGAYHPPRLFHVDRAGFRRGRGRRCRAAGGDEQQHQDAAGSIHEGHPEKLLPFACRRWIKKAFSPQRHKEHKEIFFVSFVPLW